MREFLQILGVILGAVTVVYLSIAISFYYCVEKPLQMQHQLNTENCHNKKGVMLKQATRNSYICVKEEVIIK